MTGSVPLAVTENSCFFRAMGMCMEGRGGRQWSLQLRCEADLKRGWSSNGSAQVIQSSHSLRSKCMACK